MNTEQQSLHRAILANPGEDTVRLTYADFLDELGGDCNTAQAAFIRQSIELANMGPVPKVYMGELRGAGPAYYRATAEEGEFQIGDRVSCSGLSRKFKPYDIPQLLVVKVAPMHSGRAVVSLRQDEKSVPYPKERRDELEKSTIRAMHKWSHEWIKISTVSSWYVIEGEGLRLYRDDLWDRRNAGWLGFHRGLLSRFTGPWEFWLEYGDRLVAEYPISEVNLVFNQRHGGQHIPGNGKTLVDMWPTVPLDGWKFQVRDEEQA